MRSPAATPPRSARGLQAFTVIPLMVYRVYADGRPDELVRGVDIVGTPLASFAKILATSDKPQVFNGYCGAESGQVPVSASSPAHSGFRDRDSEEAAFAGSSAVPGPADRSRSLAVKRRFAGSYWPWLCAVRRNARSARSIPRPIPKWPIAAIRCCEP